MILVVDNYDSFVHNLARYFQRLGQETLVVRNDAVTVADLEHLDPAALVLSPGPCAPQQAGRSLEFVRHFWNRKPLLGVCLGHQTIAEALGGRIVRAPEPMHGRTSLIQHDACGVFQDVPNPTVVCRYHSLVVEPATLPASLAVTARTADGVIMAIQHREAPVFGVQFHPEAILTEHGYRMLANFLTLAGLPRPNSLPPWNEEYREEVVSLTEIPSRPVTF
ncbi:MAG: aminodeoxychorismate/anthranilate synthase component II [Pirellulaceae bacterium]